LVHCLARVPGHAFFARWNFTMYLPPVWRGGGATAAFVFREHAEPDLLFLERHLTGGMVLIDAGASTGLYALTAARFITRPGSVIAFEPGRRSFDALTRSRLLNGFDHLVLRRQAVADVPSIERLYYHDGQDNMLGFSTTRQPLPYEEVQTVTIDDIVEELHLDRVDVIKLDIEGLQERALRGATRTLKRWHPTVLVEISPEACQRLGVDPDGSCRLLEAGGYQFYRVDEVGLAVLLGSYHGVRNVLAVHPTRKASVQFASAS
jgi:FkbM family methyltransferase